MLGLDVISFDKQICIADTPTSQRLTTAIDWFKKKFKKPLDDFTWLTKTNIKAARKDGAGIAALANTHATTAAIIKRIIHTA
jgi:hypothetical protein|tara:strand:+ start:3480 stop:3725 length:246 start_codon:yes stop_codon:yes gene_type:complete